jgi:hypothetical protein
MSDKDVIHVQEESNAVLDIEVGVCSGLLEPDGEKKFINLVVPQTWCLFLLARLNRAKVTTGWACRFVLSNTPIDFSRDARPLYLTEEREIARKYCEFPWSRVQRQLDLGIMEIEGDRQWLQENTTYIHGDLWKEYVHINRSLAPMPLHLEYLNDQMCLAVPFVPLAMSTDTGGSRRRTYARARGKRRYSIVSETGSSPW